MKKFILRHEKALTRIFSVFHILLRIFAFLLFSTIVVLGTLYAMTHCTFPVSTKKAVSYIDFLISQWIVCTCIIFALESWRQLVHSHVICVPEALKASIPRGIYLEILSLCLYFCLFKAMYMIDISIIFLILYITLEGIRIGYREFIVCARRKQMRKLKQCFKALAEGRNLRIIEGEKC